MDTENVRKPEAEEVLESTVEQTRFDMAERDQGRLAAELNDLQDLNQGLQTGTHDAFHRGIHFGPSYRIKERPRQEPKDKPEDSGAKS